MDDDDNELLWDELTRCQWENVGLREKLEAAQDEIEKLIGEKEALRERLEWEQPEPDDDVIGVSDHTAPDNEQDGYTWGRVHKAGEGGPHSEWKGYKNGGKVYLDWPELVRRWGPIAPTMWDKPCDGAYKSCPPGDHSHVGGVQAGGAS